MERMQSLIRASLAEGSLRRERARELASIDLVRSNRVFDFLLGLPPCRLLLPPPQCRLPPPPQSAALACLAPAWVGLLRQAL